ncbi:cytochrome P450 [Streptomyces sp. NPDC056061]|uniref:cytochrome P450 n=1 Tax=Streptomyces sp. NPDC056061 TaxID=3345700 RepID=UPI0035D53F6F
MTTETQTIEVDFDPWSPRLAGEDHEFWAVMDELRDRGPVLHSSAHGGFWIITSHEEVLAANKDWETFSSAQGVSLPHNPDAPLLAPIEVDPPEHRDWRRLLNPLMSPAAVARYEPAMRGIASDLMDEFVATGHCDLAVDFAWKFVPAALFQLLLGVAPEEVPYTRELAHRIVSHGTTQEEQNQAFADLSAWSLRHLDERENQPRRGDVVDALLHGDMRGRRLTRQEMVRAMILLIVAGMDTTSNSIGDLALHLINDPALSDLFHDNEHSVEQIVEEMLRHGSVSFGLSRVTTRETEVRGHRIPKGERVFLLWAGANRDRRVFADPETFDPSRTPNPHLAFGAGPHRCMGAHFARLMLKVAATEIDERMPGLALRPGARIDQPPGLVRSTRSLPVVFEPTPVRRAR